MTACILPVVIALALSGEPVTSAATTFGPSLLDAGNPSPGALACWRSVPGTPHYLDATTWAVANYVLPCGTLLRICSGSRCAEARVLDRGPVRARVCAVRGADGDPKCLIPGVLTTDLDVSYPVGVALGIADERGRATRGCAPLRQANGKTRGCAVTWTIIERPTVVAWGTP